MKSLSEIMQTRGLVVDEYDEDPDCGGLAATMKIGKPMFRIIASWGDDWDHVSVSLPHRCPTWDELAVVYQTFFRPDETAMQLHVPAKDHVNTHPYCLHLWRPQRFDIPLPPWTMV